MFLKVQRNTLITLLLYYTMIIYYENAYIFMASVSFFFLYIYRLYSLYINMRVYYIKMCRNLHSIFFSIFNHIKPINCFLNLIKII